MLIFDMQACARIASASMFLFVMRKTYAAVEDKLHEYSGEQCPGSPEIRFHFATYLRGP